MHRSTRPYRSRLAAAMLALLLSVGWVGAGVACAYLTHSGTGASHEAAHMPSSCADRGGEETPCVAASGCHLDRHVLSRPAAIVPGPSHEVQVDRPAFAFGTAALPAHTGSVEPTGVPHSFLSPVHEGDFSPPVALHLLYAVFLN